MSQESLEKAAQYIKVDIHKYKTVTLSKYIGNLLRDSVKLRAMAGLNIYCYRLSVWRLHNGMYDDRGGNLKVNEERTLIFVVLSYISIRTL